MHSLLDQFERVEQAGGNCPVCGRDHFCLIARDGRSVICTKIESDRRWGEAGWYHGPARASNNVGHGTVIDPTGFFCPDFGERFYIDTKQQESIIRILGERLGVTVSALLCLEVRHFNDYFPPAAIFSFPMRHGGNVEKIIGIQTRGSDGSKFTVTGSKLGLFIPRAIQTSTLRRLYVVEGASDCAAGIDIGLDIVGRASATHGSEHLQYFVAARREISEVVIIADNDESGVGLNGAKSLWKKLRRLRSCSIITPPPGVKDLRQWKTQHNATRKEIENATG